MAPKRPSAEIKKPINQPEVPQPEAAEVQLLSESANIAVMQRGFAASQPPPLKPNGILALHGAIGNRAVSRLLAQPNTAPNGQTARQVTLKPTPALSADIPPFIERKRMPQSREENVHPELGIRRANNTENVTPERPRAFATRQSIFFKRGDSPPDGSGGRKTADDELWHGARRIDRIALNVVQRARWRWIGGQWIEQTKSALDEKSTYPLPEQAKEGDEFDTVTGALRPAMAVQQGGGNGRAAQQPPRKKRKNKSQNQSRSRRSKRPRRMDARTAWDSKVEEIRAEVAEQQGREVDAKQVEQFLEKAHNLHNPYARATDRKLAFDDLECDPDDQLDEYQQQVAGISADDYIEYSDAPRKPGQAREFANRLTEALEKRGWKRYGGGQGLVLFKVTPDEKTAHGLEPRKNKMHQIHEHTHNVVGQKSYATLRTKQALRWASSIAMAHLEQDKKDPREVQSALETNKFYMASNTNKGNQALKQRAPSGTKGADALGAMHTAITLNKNRLSERRRRHARKLKKRILLKKGSHQKSYAPVQQALQQPIHIAVKGKDGLHAERRIALELGQTTLTPEQVGGVKRPCAACYIKLYLGKDIHPGPYWPSKDSNIDFDNYSQKDVNALADEINQITNTYVSKTAAASPAAAAAPRHEATHEHDTDSDTDTESESEDDKADVKMAVALESAAAAAAPLAKRGGFHAPAAAAASGAPPAVGPGSGLFAGSFSGLNADAMQQPSLTGGYLLNKAG